MANMNELQFQKKRRTIYLSLSMLVVFMVCSVLANRVWGASDLDTEIAVLQEKIQALSVDQENAFQFIKDETNLSKSALLVGGIVTAHAGNTVNWPITLVPGQFSVASLQTDFVIPIGLTFVSATVGPAATAASKQLSVSVSSGTDRALLFGLNQTSISQGVIVTLKMTVNSTATKGLYTVMLNNPVISDGKGNAVMVSTVSGTVVVN